MERAKLIAARRQKHWNQEQAADALGVNWTTLQRWERGETAPRGYNIDKLCEVYGMTAVELGLASPTPTDRPIVHDDFIVADLTTQLMSLAFVIHTSFLTLQDRMASILQEHTMNSPDEQMSRRNALRRLATLPLLSLKLSAETPVTHHSPDEIMTQCAAAVAACWELSKSDDEHDLSLAFRRVSVYIPTLKALVRDSAHHRQAAASLVGQCELLRTMLGWHLQGLKEAAAYANEAVIYAREAEDVPLLLSALDYQAWALHYDKQGRQALNTIAQALPVLKNYKAPLPPQLLGGVYSTIALMRARNGERGLPALRQAAESFFAGQKADHRFVFMDYTMGDLVLNDGMVHYQQGEHDKALDSFSQLIDPESLALKIELPERSKIEGLNVMTMATLKSNVKDMERTLHYWANAIQGARALQSEQRFAEALTSYEVMEAVWPNEKRVKELRELTLHW